MVENRKQTRRKWLGSCAGITGASALAGCFGSSDDTGDDGVDDENGGTGENKGARSSDWPMYGVDLQNTGYHPNATGPDGDDLTERAIVDLGGYSPFPVAINDGTIYVTSTAETVYGVDAEQEEIIWEEEGYGAPIVHEETVYGPTEGGTVYGPTEGGTVYGYNVDTGDRWESEEISSVPGLGDPLLIGEEAVVASHETIWRIDLNTGEYTAVVDTPAFVGSSTDVPAFHGETLYIGRSSELHAVNVETSEIEWTFEPENEGRVADSNPAVSNGMVYVTSRDRQLHAIDSDSGDELWAVDTVSPVESSPAVADGVVYIGERSQVIAADAESGDIEWRAEDAVTGEPEDIIVANGICYVTSRNGISAYDAASGDLEWEYEVPDESDVKFNAPPTIYQGTIYLPARDETLYAIEDA